MSSVRRSASKFKLQDSEGMAWACEHEVGVAQGSPEDIMMDLRANFEGEVLRGRHVSGDVQSGSQRGLSRDRYVLGTGCV